MSFYARTSSPAGIQHTAFIRYNPVLGEFFRCKYQYSDGTKGFYIAEQGKDPLSHIFKFNPAVAPTYPPSAFTFLASDPGGGTCGLFSSY